MQIYIDNTSKVHTEYLFYEANGRLNSSSSLTDGCTRTRTYDAASWANGYIQRGGNNQPYLVSEYNENSWLTVQGQYTPNKQNTSIISMFGPSFNGAGSPQTQTISYNQNGVINAIQDSLDIWYAYFDSYIPAFVGGYRTDSYGTGYFNNTESYMDSNGMSNGQSGIVINPNQNNFNAPTSSVYLETTHDGLVLRKYELVGVNPDTGVTSNVTITNYFYDAGNNVVGAYQQVLNVVTQARQQQLFMQAQLLATSQNTSRGGNILSIPLKQLMNTSFQAAASLQGIISTNVYGNQILKDIIKSMPKNHYSSFSQEMREQLALRRNNEVHSPKLVKLGLDAVHPVDKSYPPLTTGTYVVQPGDTLESIAQAELNDPNFAGLIGTANNASDQTLDAGEILQIPQQINSQYQAGYTQSYSDFMNKILYQMNPQLFAKQPPQEHESWFGEAVHAVVDIAATVIGYSVGGPLGAALATTIADAGYQELAVDEGWQQHFELKSSLAAGIEAGISSYIVPPTGSGFTGSAAAGAGSGASSAAVSVTSNALVKIVGEAGAIAVIDQLTNMALGQQSKFDFNSVIATMLSAAAMAQVGLNPGQYSAGQNFADTANQLIKGYINNIGGGFIEGFTYSELSRQSLNAELIAASALGSTAGQEIGEALVSEASLGSSKSTAAGNNNGANNASGNGNANGSAGNNGNGNNNASGGSVGGVSPGTAASASGSSASSSGSSSGSSGSSGSSSGSNGSVNSSLTANNSGSGSGAGVNGNANGNGSAGANQSSSPYSGNTNNQSARNPGRNVNGFFNGAAASGIVVSGNANIAQAGSTANNGQTPQAGQITPAGGAGASYGQGNSAVTSKISQSFTIDYGTSAGSQINWLTTSPADLNQYTPGFTALLNNSLFAVAQSNPNSSTLNALMQTSNNEDNVEAQVSWEEGMHIALGSTGMGASIGEFSNMFGNQWQGINNKWYSTSWGGNGYTGGRTLAINAAENFHNLGTYAFYIDAIIGGYQIYDDWDKNNLLAIGPTIFDTTMGGVGAFGGPVGFGLSALYFIPKWTIQNWSSIQNSINVVDEIQEEAVENGTTNNNMGRRIW